jgi:hypothetical protein
MHSHGLVESEAWYMKIQAFATFNLTQKISAELKSEPGFKLFKKWQGKDLPQWSFNAINNQDAHGNLRFCHGCGSSGWNQR